MFEFILVCVVDGWGCAWPSWLFCVAFGEVNMLFQVVSNCLRCFIYFLIYSGLRRLRTF